MSQTTEISEATEKEKQNKSSCLLVIIPVVFVIIMAVVFCSGGSSGSDATPRNTKEAYDKVMLMTVTEDYVKNYLVSPSTADFPRNQDWKITDNGSVITVSSYVDAQNSLGGTVREHFTAKYKLPDVTLTYLEIGGEVMIEY